jgi:hypothetical protein
MKTCKVCFKRYDPRSSWQVLSHEHQGQGPGGKLGRDS